MSDIEIGQVLSLKVRYNNAGTVLLEFSARFKEFV